MNYLAIFNLVCLVMCGLSFIMGNGSGDQGYYALFIMIIFATLFFVGSLSLDVWVLFNSLK